jgi:hypothetical protein
MWRLTVILAACLVTCGCRCQSDLERPPGRDAGVVSKEAPVERWCRACALKNFLSCKRVSGVGTEAEVRRKAELEACADLGYGEAECTSDRIRFVECGTE